MSFKDVLDNHSDHNVVIIPRLHKNRFEPVPGLYCEHCAKLIKWLNYSEAKDLLEAGVEGLDMLPDELAIWTRRSRLSQKNTP